MAEPSAELRFHSDAYLSYLQLERGVSPRTVTSYRLDLDLFQTFCASRRVRSPGQVTQQLVRDFLQWLRQGSDGATARSPSTVARKLACLRGFFRFLTAQAVIPKNPTAFIESPRLWRRLPGLVAA